MRSIAIILNDNDFYHTFVPLLESVANAMLWCEERSEAEVTRIINAGVMFHYMAFQNQEDLGGDKFQEDYDHTIGYLQSRLRILFDDAADLAYENEDHDGGAWHLHIASGQVNPF